MQSPSRILLIGLLVAAFSHAPIPWIHRHDEMRPEQLRIHLQQFHQGASTNSAALGWHYHVIPLTVSDSSAEHQAAASSRSLARMPEWLHSPTPTCHLSFHGDLFDTLPMLRSTVSTEGHSGWPNVDLFKLYESLLI
ncbi:MAG: hypothetical protein WDZ51_15975 [Pirellulaceae bacterium]